MFDPKTLIGLLAVALTFVGYFHYFRDIKRGQTKPHVFSWLIWSITTGTVYALQVSAGAGPGAWVTLALAVIMVLIFFLSLKPGDKRIKPIDIVFLVLALGALPLWLLVEQPVLSIILLIIIDVLGFGPTLRKSWSEPYSENLPFYVITTFRHAITLFALSEYNIITYLYPIAWVAVNAIFSIIIIIRRRAVAPPVK